MLKHGGPKPMVWTIASVLVLALAGCSLDKSPDKQGSSAPGEATNLTTIRTEDSEFVGGSGLALYLPPEGPRYELSINGRSSTGEGWAVRAYLDAESVASGESSIGMISGSTPVGIASLTRQSTTNELVQASTATLSFNFQAGRVTGTVTGAVPDNLDATFEGTLGVVCYVPASGDAEGGGLHSEDGGAAPVLTIDESLQHPACAPVRPWAR